MRIPMSSPDISQAEINAVNEVLTTQWLALGPKMDQFEVRSPPTQAASTALR